MYSEFARVTYEVATDCDSDAVGVFFLRTVVYNNLSVGNCSVSWDELNAVMVEKENGVGAGCTHLALTLCKPLSSFPNLVVQISHMTGSFASSLNLLMVFPVLGCTTGLAKCSRLGM